MKTVTNTIADRSHEKTFLVFIITLVMFIGLSLANRTHAQPVYAEAVVIPSWAPAYSNVDQVRYYYLPDLRIFYDVNRGMFITPNGGYWVASYSLPRAYQNYDLNKAYVVLLDKKARTPWKYAKKYNALYPCNYYYRFADRTISGFDENSKTLVYRMDYRTGTEQRLDAINDLRHNRGAANNNTTTSRADEQQSHLQILDDKKGSRNDNKGTMILR